MASPTLTTTELGRLQQLARRERLALRLVARVPHMLTNRLTLQRVGPLMTVAVRQAKLTGTQAALKRAFDITHGERRARGVAADPARGRRARRRHLSGAGALPSAARDRGNKLFTVYKFRTMDRDADRIMDERDVDRTQPFFKDPDVAGHARR